MRCCQGLDIQTSKFRSFFQGGDMLVAVERGRSRVVCMRDSVIRAHGHQAQPSRIRPSTCQLIYQSAPADVVTLEVRLNLGDHTTDPFRHQRREPQIQHSHEPCVRPSAMIGK